MGCTGLTTPGAICSPWTTWRTRWATSLPPPTPSTPRRRCGAGARSAGNSVEPGSGSSIMASAGTCPADNLQPHADPYWSMRSFDDITNYVATAEALLGKINEVQMIALTGFDGTDSFQLRFNGSTSAPIVRGMNVNVTGMAVRDALLELGRLAAGYRHGRAEHRRAVLHRHVRRFTGGHGRQRPGAGELHRLQRLRRRRSPGAVFRPAWAPSRPPATRSRPSPRPALFTIPVRTPFALTGRGEDPDGDALTYMWEQNDRGGTDGHGAPQQHEAQRPALPPVWHAPPAVSDSDALRYGAPGTNAVSTNPTRVFPDLAQILANNTNAETGTCPPGDVEMLLGVPAHVRVRGVRRMEREPPVAALPPDRARRAPGRRRREQRDDHAASWPRTPGRSWSPPEHRRRLRRRVHADGHVGRRPDKRPAGQHGRRQDQLVLRRRAHVSPRAGGGHAERRLRRGVPPQRRDDARTRQGRGRRQRLLRRVEQRLHHPGPALRGPQRARRRRGGAIQRFGLAGGDRLGQR